MQIDEHFVELSKYRRIHHLLGQDVLFEFPWSDNSILGQVPETVGVLNKNLDRLITSQALTHGSLLFVRATHYCST